MLKSTCSIVLILGILLGPTGNLRAGEETEAETEQLQERMQQLEKRVAELEKAVTPMSKKFQLYWHREELRERARSYMRKADENLSSGVQKEIETLYRVANKKWGTVEAKESLQTLIAKYPQVNRAGCALLYLGQMSEGREKEGYFNRAIADYGDCWYGDGAQVGAYARFLLAQYYRQIGKNEDAAKLFNEIREKYPEAIDHRGKLLVDRIAE